MIQKKAAALLSVGLSVAAITWTAAQSRTAAHPEPEADAQALEIAKKSIALRSVTGPGNQTVQVAELYKVALVAAGFSAGDISITPVDDTAYLIARWPGSDPALKPLVLSGHMDVVEAKRADWERDPFTAVVENGYLYGRGASDMKLDGAIALASLIELRRESYKPRRTIVIEFSGDEETTMKTSAMIAEKLADAEMVLNIDGGGGVLDEKTGAPLYFTWQGAEKTYADFELAVTNAGGHSSQPRKDNAIDELAAALLKVADYRFTPELNDLTRAYFQAASKYEDPQVADAMRAFAANPADAKAIATLSAKPDMVGKIGTTCVVTMINGGHALNALPQRATANVNCRIFPGHPPASIMAALKQVIANPNLVIKGRDGGDRADRRLAHEAGLHHRGDGGHGRELPGRSGIPQHGLRRERQYVVPLTPRAQLRREPHIHEAVRRLQSRPERADAHREHRARDQLLPECGEGIDEVTRETLT
jgi:acetylornithine deacetylase/succinyl-diaminopimelate desuccinylase-like protein